MKKLLVVMLSLCMIIGLTACGGDTGGGSSVLPTKTISTDEFITSLKKGLEKRWKISKSHDEEAQYYVSESDYADNLKLCVDAELDNISNYKNSEFEDEEVGKLAKEYIEILEAQKEDLDNMTSKMYATIYNYIGVYGNRRANVLTALNDISEITFESDDNNEIFKEISTPNKDVNKDEVITNTISIEKTDAYYDDFGDEGIGDYYNVYITIKNNTNIPLYAIYLNVTPYDEDGVALESKFAVYKNVKAYAKTRNSALFFRDDLTRDNIKEFKVESYTIYDEQGYTYDEVLDEPVTIEYKNVAK